MKNTRMITLREANNWTQEQLGQAVGLTQSMIARTESGEREPSKDHRIAIAKKFGVSVEYLFYSEDEESTGK